MAYVGNVPAVAYTNTVKDTFSGDGSTVAFTLSVPSTTNNVRAVVENVIQDPTVAYSVSGTTLTFTSAPPAGTDNIYVVHLGPAVQTVQPPTQLSGNFTLAGALTVDTAGATVLTVDRASSDGTIIDLQKDGSSVGSIGTWSGINYIGSGDTGIAFAFGNDDIRPFNPSSVAQRDGAISLGETGTRFKDLYLSGGVYLGGTGSANLLDDYEEGSWTPVVNRFASSPSVTYSNRSGRYVKIGNFVFASYDLTASSVSGGSGAATLTGLPFNASSNNLMAGFSVVQYRSSSLVTASGTAGAQLKGYVSFDRIELEHDNSGTSGYSTIGFADWGSSGRITGYVIYNTEA
jgi:hypothetical protein